MLPKAKAKSEVEQAITSGQFPPCILYKVFYSVHKEQRVKPAQLTVTLQGEHLKLRFNCRIMEENRECVCVCVGCVWSVWYACVCMCGGGVNVYM